MSLCLFIITHGIWRGQRLHKVTSQLKIKQPGLEVIKLFSCSTQLSTKFPHFIKTKIPKSEEISCFKSLRCGIYHANNVKMPTIVGILTIMSRIKFVLS